MLGFARTPLVHVALATLSFSCYAQTGATQKTATEADAAYSQKRYSDALAAYRSVADSTLPEPLRARALTRVGYCLYRLADRPAARAAWESVPDRFPTQSDFACDALLRAGNVAAAAQDYEGAIADYRRASDNYHDKATTSDARATAAEALCRLGSAYLNRAESDKATVPGGQTIAAAWAAGSDNFERAKSAFERVPREYPECAEWVAEARMQLVALSYEYAFSGSQGAYSDVVEEADAFLAAFPEDPVRRPTVLLLRAEALHEDGKPEAALRDVDVIISAYAATAGPSLGQAQYLRARCLHSRYDFEAALKAYRLFLDERRPCFLPEVHRPLAQYYVGLCLEGLGRPDQAITALEAVCHDYPDSWAVVRAADRIAEIRGRSKD
jgi:tetratricopeptide (TPR) repeat protein